MMTAWSMSQRNRVPPSELYGLADPLVAYCFNDAVTHWGVSLEAAIQEATKDAKTEHARTRAADRVIRRYVPSTRHYADPTQR